MAKQKFKVCRKSLFSNQYCVKSGKNMLRYFYYKTFEQMYNITKSEGFISDTPWMTKGRAEAYAAILNDEKNHSGNGVFHVVPVFKSNDTVYESPVPRFVVVQTMTSMGSPIDFGEVMSLKYGLIDFASAYLQPYSDALGDCISFGSMLSARIKEISGELPESEKKELAVEKTSIKKAIEVENKIGKECRDNETRLFELHEKTNIDNFKDKIPSITDYTGATERLNKLREKQNNTKSKNDAIKDAVLSIVADAIRENSKWNGNGMFDDSELADLVLAGMRLQRQIGETEVKRKNS